MSFRPRKVAGQPKQESMVEMFSTNGVIDFKSGVVFDPATTEVKGSDNASEIRQCVTDTMLKVVEPQRQAAYLAAPNVDDIEQTVRMAVRKHLDQELSIQSNAVTKTDIKNIVRSTTPSQYSSQNVESTITRASVDEAVRTALAKHMPSHSKFEREAPRSGVDPIITRASVEKAVRAAIQQHMPTPTMSNHADGQYDRVERAVRAAVEKHIPRTNTVPTSSARGNQMREMLY